MYDLSIEQIIKTKAPAVSGVYKAAAIVAAVLSLTTIPAVGTFGIILCVIFLIIGFNNCIY